MAGKSDRHSLFALMAAYAHCGFSQEVMLDFLKIPDLYPSHDYFDKNVSGNIDSLNGFLLRQYGGLYLARNDGLILR